ncbi:MAG: hypothetical protein GEU81_01705 [Nitriliruptorales bacterium]|nr:hypothetical protein [Nitriliruptorales bacterium]
MASSSPERARSAPPWWAQPPGGEPSPPPAATGVRVVTVGFAACAVAGGRAPDRVFAEALSRNDLDSLAAFVTEAAADGGHVVVVYPAWSAEPTLQRLETIRAILGTRRLSWHASALAPLAGAVLASLAGTLAARVPGAGALVAGLPLVERQLVTATWLSRLSGLERPAPSIWQHLVSLWPTTAFSVCSWPRLTLRRVARGAESLPLPRATGPVGLAVAAAGGDRDWVRRAVAAPLGHPRLILVESPPASVRYWGAKRLVETVAHPADPGRLAGQVCARLRLHACSWCGEPGAGRWCAFCGLDSAGDADAQGPFASPNRVV